MSAGGRRRGVVHAGAAGLRAPVRGAAAVPAAHQRGDVAGHRRHRAALARPLPRPLQRRQRTALIHSCI